MRLWIAEIPEHLIAHVLGDETVEPGDRLRDALPLRDRGHLAFPRGCARP
jgi:hypothetical protein